MNTPKDELPQEWPVHLAPEAEVSVVKTVPPIGEPLLNFTAMPPATFEQFCWWLLKKDQTLIGCKRLGRSGTAQDGIDLFAFNGPQDDSISVFECKAWDDFRPAKLKEAVDAFLGSSWISSTRSFTLILAQREVGQKLARRWLIDKERLKEVGVDGELWTAHTLTLKVQSYPDILSKFFPWHSVESFANQWMQRVAFYELVSKAFFDPRERVARWARELMAGPEGITHPDPPTPSLPDSAIGELNRDAVVEQDAACGPSFIVDGTYRQVNRFGNSWHFKGPWLSLSAILPDQRFTHASIAITFKRPDMQGMTLTVDHKWLLNKFLFRVGAPLSSQYRGFIVGGNPQELEQYLIDLPHCRLFLQNDGANEIAQVADLLTGAMRDALQALELSWSASDFPFVMSESKKVALAAIDADVWHEIARFAQEHDVSKGNTPWHMFDGNRHILKPYHATATQEFDAGYHGVIHAVEIEGLSYKKEVILLWRPNELQPDQKLSPRGWWSCEFAFKWLNETLLPEVKQRVYSRNFGSVWKRIRYSKQAAMFAAHLDTLFVTRDLRQPPLMRNGEWSCGIVNAVEELQGFFHSAWRPEPYIRQHEMEDLYRAAAVLAEGKRGYLGYIRSNLGLKSDPADHEELICMIKEHIQREQVAADSSMADYVFRAMLEMLNESDTWLSGSEQAMIRDALVPFALLRDDAILIDRHSKWA